MEHLEPDLLPRWIWTYFQYDQPTHLRKKCTRILSLSHVSMCEFIRAIPLFTFVCAATTFCSSVTRAGMGEKKTIWSTFCCTFMCSFPPYEAIIYLVTITPVGNVASVKYAQGPLQSIIIRWGLIQRWRLVDSNMSRCIVIGKNCSFIVDSLDILA